MIRRVALIGYFLEVNAFSPVTEEANFRALCHVEGEDITLMMRQETSVLPLEVAAFVSAMDGLEAWEPVPISVIASTPGGPVDQVFYDRWLADIRQRLENAGALDGVYIANHGAGAATHDQDSDGTLYALVRDVVGATTPIVATLDLHANISERMVETVDMMIAYTTNPHVDQKERAQEAANALCALWRGLKPVKAFIRLPICPPSVALLTAEGPFADLIALARERLSDEVINISLFGNFSFADLPKNGLAIVVSARSDLAKARAVCLELAQHGWADRHRYQCSLTSLEAAVASAMARSHCPGIPSRIYADVADNPGGGGSGRTMWLLEALHAAGAHGVLAGVFCDPLLAAETHLLGEGARFDAVFNRDIQAEFVHQFTASAQVVKLHDGNIVGRRGNRRGRVLPHGPACLLDLGGILVAVSSRRLQCFDPIQFEMFGADIAVARTVVVKSRGHFRAGFDEFFTPDRVDEIDTPGLTSPILARFAFRHLPRPVYPLDEDAIWTPPGW